MRSLPLGVTPWQGGFAAFAGLLGAAAFPPVGQYPCILVSIVLLLWVLRDLDVQAARNVGVVYGMTFGLGTMYWFFAVFGFIAVPLIALMAIYWAVFAWCVAMTRGMGGAWRALLVAAFAVGIEWLRGDAWYLRFPWYTAPHALAQEPLWIGGARWLGVYGLSYVIWAVLAAGVFIRPPIVIGVLLLPVAGFLLPGFAEPDRRVMLIQAEGELDMESVVANIKPAKVDLLVMPEYAYTRSVRSALKLKQGPASLAKAMQCPVVFGAVEGEYGTLNFSNVAAVIDAEGKLLGTFPKQHPVPLMLDGVPGKERPVFPVGDGVLGVAVCYDLDAPEVAASLVRQGATVLVAPTMDALWWTRIQHVHHELLLRLRAVENDRWVLRAVTSGRSEVIDPHGQATREGIEIGEKGMVTLPFGHRDGTALGGQMQLFGPACAGVMGVFVMWRAVRSWRGRVKSRRVHPGGLTME